jgi:hypothetical protein
MCADKMAFEIVLFTLPLTIASITIPLSNKQSSDNPIEGN